MAKSVLASRVGRVIPVALIAATLTGCGQFLYVGDAPSTPGSSAAIEVFDIRNSGSTQQMVRKPGITLPATIGAPSAMVVVNKSLYVAGGSSVLAQFTIDNMNGNLTLGATIPTGAPPQYMAATSNAIYVGGFGSNDIRAYSVASNGALTNVQTTPANGINSLHVESASGKFVFSGHRAVGATSPQLCTHTIQSNGSLGTPNCVAIAGAPSSIQSFGGVLFVLFNAIVPPAPGNTNWISAWNIDPATGALTKRGTDLDIGAANTGRIAISADGKRLFVPRQGGFNIVGTANPLTMSAAGFPTQQSQSCILPPVAGSDVVVNPNGNAMYLTDSVGGTAGNITGRRITAFDLTSGNALTPITCEATGNIPQSMAIFAQ